MESMWRCCDGWELSATSVFILKRSTSQKGKLGAINQDKFVVGAAKFYIDPRSIENRATIVCKPRHGCHFYSKDTNRIGPTKLQAPAHRRRICSSAAVKELSNLLGGVHVLPPQDWMKSELLDWIAVWIGSCVWWRQGRPAVTGFRKRSESPNT